MSYLNEEDFEDLPEEDSDAFVQLEAIARRRFSDVPENDFKYHEYMSYMNEISALAHHYGIPDIYVDLDPNDVVGEYYAFTRRVEYRVIQIRAQRARRVRQNSVTISGPSRQRIQHYLEQLKEEVLASNLPERRKQVLLDKIADFEAELAKRRFNLALAMGVVALVAASSSDFSDAANKVWGLAQSISEVIGREKEQEEERQKLLSSREPLKAIPDMRVADDYTSRPLATGGGWTNVELDDDIPF